MSRWYVHCLSRLYVHTSVPPTPAEHLALRSTWHHSPGSFTLSALFRPLALTSSSLLLSSSSTRFRGSHVILFSFLRRRRALANHVDTWVSVILVMIASMIFSPLVGYGFFLCSFSHAFSVLVVSLVAFFLLAPFRSMPYLYGRWRRSMMPEKHKKFRWWELRMNRSCERPTVMRNHYYYYYYPHSTGYLQLYTWNKPCLGYIVLQLFCIDSLFYMYCDFAHEVCFVLSH